MTTTRVSIGDEKFWLPADTATEVLRLALTDKQAALTLARRTSAAGGLPSVPSGGGVTVPMMLMDSAPVPSLPPTQPRTPTMPTNPMAKILIGDRDHYVDARVANEIDALRGENAALKAIAAGTDNPPAGQQGTTRASTAHLSNAEFFRAQEAARNDPNTAQGQYRQYLENAHKTAR